MNENPTEPKEAVPGASDYIIKVNHLSFSYKRGQEVFRDVSFGIRSGEVVAVAGESGCGKTTLLYILKGIIPHEIKGRLSGEVIVDVFNVRKTSIARMALSVGMVFQDLNAQLFSNSVLDEVLFGLNNFGMDPRKAWDSLRLLGIEHLADRIPMNLSAGQKQRVILASVLALEPKILLLDEPAIHLDPKSKRALRDYLAELNRNKGITVVIASNDPYLIGELCDDILFISESKIIRKSKSELMIQSPCWRWRF